MGDAGPCGGCCQGSPSGVGKKVQHLYRPSGVSDLFREPVPVYRLFREEPGMFEAEWLQVKGKIFVADLPLLGKIEKFPLAAAFLAPVIMSVGMFPSCVGPGSVPDDLGVRTDQQGIFPIFPAFHRRKYRLLHSLSMYLRSTYRILSFSSFLRVGPGNILALEINFLTWIV